MFINTIDDEGTIKIIWDPADVLRFRFNKDKSTTLLLIVPFLKQNNLQEG